MQLVQLLILVGAPGLALGIFVGAVVLRWPIVLVLTALSALALMVGLSRVADQPERHGQAAALVALAMVTNTGGWVAGLVLGAAAVSMRRGPDGR